MDNQPTSASGQKEKDAAYWKSQSEIWQAKYEECRLELDEFTVSSGELEQELEKELKESQQQNATLRNDLRTVTEENRHMKEQEQRHARRIDALEDAVKNYEGQKQAMMQYRRELEQKNDELETSDRNLTASLSDHARRIEALMEEKALLENELEQTRGQKEAEQRLRDELRDLRDEMAARNRADDGRQSAQRERRRTMEQTLMGSDHELLRLQSISAGGDLTNGHDLGPQSPSHRACQEREAELKAALAAHSNSSTVIQNLILKISSLENEMLGVRRGSLKMNGQHA